MKTQTKTKNTPAQIYDLLKEDHDKTKKLLNKLCALDAEDIETRDELVQAIRDDLIPHARAEEAVFYNSLRALTDDTDKVMHGYKEHMEAEGFLRALQLIDKVGVEWRATAEKLRDSLEHHIKEEESEIFKLGRKVLSDEEAVAVGKAFKKMKPEVREEGFLKNTLDLAGNLMPPRLKTALGGNPPEVSRS